MEKLKPYIRGWKTYFGLAQTPRVWRDLDEWLRHLMRALQLWHWNSGRVIYRELIAHEARHEVAWQVAANSRRWWRNSAKLLNSLLIIVRFDRLGLPRLS